MIKLYLVPQTRSVRILWLLESGFSAADIMMGFTLVAGKLLDIWSEGYPALDG